jgi:hypothetical protein
MRRRQYSAKRRGAHLAGEADLRAPFERLVDTGVRSTIAERRGLREFLVDEITELSGAERVLLVLDAPEGTRVTCCSCPRKTPVLLKAIAPWLDAARRTRVTAVRYLRESGPARPALVLSRP